MELSLITGGPCNGAGDLVNDSLCLCYPLYSGGSDFFDTRFVDSNPALSLTCSSSRVGEYILWGAVLLGILIRVIGNIKMFREKFQDFKDRNQRRGSWTWEDFRKNFAIRILLFDLLILTPMCLTTARLKIAGEVMGTDIPVTIFYVLVVVCFQYGNGELAHQEFNAVTHFVPKAERARLVNLRLALDVVSWISYLMGVVGPSVAALFLDKSLGPLGNLEFVAILVRNLFVVLWSAFSLWSNYIVFSKFQDMLGSMPNSKSAEAVQHMSDANKSLIRLYAIISLVYVIFCIPSLWAFQTYGYGLIVFVGTFRSPSKAFKSMRTYTTGGTGDSGVNPAKEENKVSPAVPPSEMGSLVQNTALESQASPSGW